MIRYVYDFRGVNLIRTEESAPVCGQDFCDACGDCLYCYGGDTCYETASGEHLWVEYSEEES